MSIVAGIDVGTQSTKVLLYDTETKNIIAESQAPHQLITGEDGLSEQKALWWIEAIEECFLAIDEKLTSRIEAIGVSGQQHGFVPIGDQGEVLYNVKLWNDTSTATECEELTSCAGGEASLLEQEGNLILPGYTASKILWFKKNHKELYDKMKYILLPHDYINYYLTGNVAMEYGDASGTALLDIRTRTWSKRLLRCIDNERTLEDALPPLIEAHHSVGTIRPEIAQKLRISPTAIVSSGGGDNMMGAIGTGTVRDGTLTVSLGTSGTMYGASDTPLIDKEGYLAAFCSSSGTYLPLLCTMNCTVASEVTRSLFDLGVKEFDAIAHEAPIGSEGVVMLPYFTGERTPNYPRGKGSLMGFTLENMTMRNINRSALESALFGLRLGLESFENLGYTATEIRLIGGGAKSKVWRQMASDIFNLPVVIPTVSESAALGAALQAYWALKPELSIGEIVDQHVVLDERARYTPHKESVEKYHTAYATYKRYVDAVEPLYK